MKTLLAVKQAATTLGLSDRTLARMRLEGNGPVFLKLGGRILYDPDNLATWVNCQRFQSTSEYQIKQAQ